MARTALVLLFPQCFYTDIEVQALAESARERGFDRLPDLLIEFREHVATARAIVDAVYLITARDLRAEMLPLSDLFLPAPSDIVVDSGVITEADEGWYQWKTHPDWNLLASGVDGDEVMVGGFHLFDCVQKFCQAAEERGKQAVCRMYLTSFYFTQLCGCEVRGSSLWREVPENVRHDEVDKVMGPISRRIHDYLMAEFKAFWETREDGGEPDVIVAPAYTT